MKRTAATFISLFGLCFGSCLLLMSCGSVTDNSSSGSDLSSHTNAHTNWLIPTEEVVDGGPGKDGIPSVDNPKFSDVSSIRFIPDERRVVGIRIGNEIKAYPHQILDWHEIVNDRVGDEPVALTFCPLTGTGLAWSRNVDGTITEFGVSGLLFRNNLIPYDRTTDSHWSQMQIRSVAGDLAGTNAETFQVVETTWRTWKQMYPESQVLTPDTGFIRDYNGYTYGKGYSTNHDQILFPVAHPNNALPNKTRVHGILPEEARVLTQANPKVYPIQEFGEGISVVHDRMIGKEIVVAGSGDLDFAAVFYRDLPDGTRLEFQPLDPRHLPAVMKDGEGNHWDVFGRAVSGPRSGQQLKPVRGYTGYWFAWADFYPELRIYQTPS